MAGKKKDSATVPHKWEDIPEIPKEEQPYPLPEGWKWVYLGDAIQLLRGVSYSKEDAHKSQHKDDYLILRGGNIKEGYIDFNASDNIYINKNLIKDDQLIKKNDIVIVSSTGSIKVIGRAGIADKNCNDVAFGAFLTLARPNKYFNSRYVDYFFQSEMYRSRIRKLVKGVNINNIKNEYIALTSFPAPPHETQQRIVNHIESLFSKLDEAAEKVQAVIDSHEARKQAILHKAFNGGLTQDVEIIEDENYKNITEIPKEEQPYPLPQGWKWVKLKDLYLLNPKVKADDTVTASFVPMAKISSGMTGKFTYEIKPWGKIKKGFTQFEDGDVAFAKISPCFENGKRMLVQNLKNGIGAGTTELIILRNKNVSLKFSLYLISTDRFIKNGIKTYSGTVGQQRINMDYVRNYPIPLPPIQTQQRIIARIESLFSQLDEVIEASEKILDKIKNMKNSILTLSFQGKLC